MSRIILTDARDGRKFHVRGEDITMYGPEPGDVGRRTEVVCQGRRLYVTESPEEIAKLLGDVPAPDVLAKR